MQTTKRIITDTHAHIVNHRLYRLPTPRCNMQNETRTVVPKRSSPKIRESRVPREIDIYLYICWCVSHFRVDHPFFPILLFFPRTKIVSSLSILAPSSVVHFVSITFSNRCSPMPISGRQSSPSFASPIHVYIYRSLKEKSNNR